MELTFMRTMIVLALTSLTLFSPTCLARDDVQKHSIIDAMSQVDAQAKLGENVAFYFGEQEYGEIAQSLSQVKTNKKTNAFNKSDLEACQWVFLSAMIALKEKALQLGANAVVEIKSNYKNNLSSNTETFNCGAGTFMAGVALTGKLVKLK
jgi:uncharacterized protein YbjQ (UPF0145 family)